MIPGLMPTIRWTTWSPHFTLIQNAGSKDIFNIYGNLMFDLNHKVPNLAPVTVPMLRLDNNGLT